MCKRFVNLWLKYNYSYNNIIFSLQITSSNDHGALKSSKSFFNKLQDTTTDAAVSKGKRPKKDVSKANAKKLKL